MTSRRIQKPIRVLTIASFVWIMAFGPLNNQVLGYNHPLVRTWVMYRYASLDLCWADYTQIDDQGNARKLDRYRILGHESMWDAPRDIRWLRGPKAVIKTASKMCEKLGSGSDIRAYGSCADNAGWRPSFAGEENLCPTASGSENEAAAPPTPKAKSEPKQNKTPRPTSKQKRRRGSR